MRCLVPLLLAWASPAAAQMSQRATAGWLDLGVGAGAVGLPVGPSVRWSLGVGGLVGRYDPSFAVGRGVGVGLRVQQDLLPTGDGLRLQTLPGVEAWYALDLLVVNLALGGLVGLPMRTTLTASPGEDWPAPGDTELGWVSPRAVASLGYRFDKHLRLLVRLEAGVDVMSAPVRVDPAVSITVGLGALLPGPAVASPR